MLVQCYGLHQQPDDTLVFLEEEDGGRCLTPGLGQLPSPFEVMSHRRLRCPHEFGEPLDEPALDHPFVRAMGPDQTGGLFFVPEEDAVWIHRLARMTPARETIVETVWFQPIQTIGHRVGPRLLLTNAAPLCLVEAAYRDFARIELLTHYPRLRNLVLSGGLAPPGAVTLSPEGLDPNHDWATEGRRQLHATIQRRSSHEPSRPSETSP